MAAIRLVEAQPRDSAVIGLIKGFGTVALHGGEGFRAEMAMVTCVFADEIARAPVGRLWRSFQRRFRGWPGDRTRDQVPGDTKTLKSVADHYGVPLVSLESALSIGLLSELGVHRDAILELQSSLHGR